jgi:hypothetical protein
VKRKHQNNLIRLIFVHLLLLAYPLVSKTVHVHHSEPLLHECCASACLDHPENHCPVCDFEFYNFVADHTIQLSVESQILSVFNSPEPPIRYVSFIPYFSLRAPPVA